MQSLFTVLVSLLSVYFVAASALSTSFYGGSHFSVTACAGATTYVDFYRLDVCFVEDTTSFGYTYDDFGFARTNYEGIICSGRVTSTQGITENDCVEDDDASYTTEFYEDEEPRFRSDQLNIM